MRALPAVLPLFALVGLALPLPARAAPAAGRVPPVYEMALPARVVFVAFLDAAGRGDKLADQVDLDIKVEAVLPMKCGDAIAGLLRSGGPTLDGPDSYELVIERRAIARCDKEPARIGARAAIRLRLADGQKKELVIGGQGHPVERKGAAVTLDGGGPEGDVPGAPPTARPTTLVLGEASAATLVKAARDAAEPDSVRAAVKVTARWPSCAGAPLGLLGRGDASTRFTLTRFEPIAVAPLDAPCGGKPASRSAEVETVLHLARAADRATITVGAASLVVPVGPAPAAPSAAPATPAPAAPSTAPATPAAAATAPARPAAK